MGFCSICWILIAYGERFEDWMPVRTLLIRVEAFALPSPGADHKEEACETIQDTDVVRFSNSMLIEGAVLLLAGSGRVGPWNID